MNGTELGWKIERTDNAGDTVCTRDRIPVITFVPFKGLGHINRMLLLRAEFVHLGDTALCDH